MLGLWICSVLLLVLLLLSRLRVGVRAALRGDDSTADLTIGPFRVRLYPAKTDAGAEQAPEEKPPKKPKRKREKAAKPLPKPGLADVKSAVRALTPAVRRALRRTRRSVRVDPLDLSVTLGGAEDPAAAAEVYGYLHGAVWTAMPALEQLLVIPDPHIHLGLDFDAPAARAEGTLGVSIRLGTVLAAGFGIGFPALRWFLQYQKQKRRQQPPAPETQAPAAGPAA